MKRFLITGGTGFLGRHLFIESPSGILTVGVGKNFDLTNYDETHEVVSALKPDVVIHGCGNNGGIEFNRLYPADILDTNMRMTSNIFNACKEVGVDKMVCIATSCAYPDMDTTMKEEEFWSGNCNESIRCHGLAKRMLQAYCEMYHKQHGMNCVTAAVTNLYGPHDTFNLTRTKVVGAVIRKVVEGKLENKPEIEFWGTGKPMRQFMYVVDAARAILDLANRDVYSDTLKPINIGTPSEFSIKDLVDKTVEMVGYEGNVKWLTEKGDGQMRKYMDVSTMKELMNFSITPFEVGLKETIDWYIENKEEADRRP